MGIAYNRSGVAAAAFALCAGFASLCGAQEQAPVPGVDTTNRQQVLALYQDYYVPSNNIDPGWTGNLLTGDPGTLSVAFLDATLQRINYYRAMSGVSSDIALSALYNSECQQAALMFAAQGDISHTPPTSWFFYTAEAADAAANSNIRLDSSGDEGPGAVDRYMADAEPNNFYVGHRRWFVYPPQGPMGAGAVPSSYTNVGTSAIWVVNYAARSMSSTLSTSWPPAGFVPASLVFDRWSFSYLNADFTSAIVTVNKGGVMQTVEQEPLEGNSGDGSNTFVGDNTIVWEMPNNVVSEANDETYDVHLANVIVNGVPQQFDYAVTSFNPDPSNISLSAIAPVAHRNGQLKGKILLTRDGDVSQPLAIAYSVAGTGVPGQDYAALNGTATFAAGLSVTKIRVIPSATPSSPGKKSVTVTLQAGGGYSLVDPVAATVMIKQ